MLAMASPAPVQCTDSVQDARAIAARCASLAELAAALVPVRRLPIAQDRHQSVLLDGNPQAHVLVIGEAPGNEEDLQGKPFVGRSGQLLDRMLAAIGLDRHAEDPTRAVLITNTIFWRPPGNRKPTEAETAMCMPFVLRLVEVMRPRLILCAGATPTQRMMNLTEGILKLRGRWFDVAIGARKSRCSPLCILPICCASRRRSVLPGAIFCRCGSGSTTFRPLSSG